MHPVLFVIPGWGPINAYGTLIMLGGALSMPGVYWELRNRGLRGRTVSIKARFADFKTVTRSRTLDYATNLGPRIYSTARDLFRYFEAMFAGRLVRDEFNWLSAGWDGGTALAGGNAAGLQSNQSHLRIPLDQSANGSVTRIVSSRSGLVDNRAT